MRAANRIKIREIIFIAPSPESVSLASFPALSHDGLRPDRLSSIRLMYTFQCMQLY